MPHVFPSVLVLLWEYPVEGNGLMGRIRMQDSNKSERVCIHSQLVYPFIVFHNTITWALLHGERHPGHDWIVTQLVTMAQNKVGTS